MTYKVIGKYPEGGIETIARHKTKEEAEFLVKEYVENFSGAWKLSIVEEK